MRNETSAWINWSFKDVGVCVLWQAEAAKKISLELRLEKHILLFSFL